MILTRKVRTIDGFNVEDNPAYDKFPFKKLMIGHRTTFVLGHDKYELNNLMEEISNIPNSSLTPILEKKQFPGHSITNRMIILIDLKGLKPVTIKDRVISEFLERKKNFPYTVGEFLPVFVFMNFDISLNLLQIIERCEIVSFLMRTLPKMSELIIPITTYEPFEHFRGNKDVVFTSLANGKVIQNAKYLTYRNQVLASKKAYDLLTKKNINKRMKR